MAASAWNEDTPETVVTHACPHPSDGSHRSRRYLWKAGRQAGRLGGLPGQRQVARVMDRESTTERPASLRHTPSTDDIPTIVAYTNLPC